MIALSTGARQSTDAYLLELIPLSSLGPSVVERRFLVAPAGNWSSSVEFERVAARVAGNVSAPKGLPAIMASSLSDPLVVEFADRDAIPQLLARVDRERFGSAWQHPPILADASRNEPAAATGNGAPPATEGQQKLDRDATLRLNQAQAVRSQQGNSNSLLFAGPAEKGRLEVAAVVGPLVPAWLGRADKGRLVLGRRLELGDKAAYDLAVVDWTRLRSSLAEDVRDLLPQVTLRPVADRFLPSSERALTALPVELDLKGPGPIASAGWTPLRVGLALAWAGVVVALAAVGLGGWSLIEIAERRMRFVSAVTHELRTPLTTLRLYLDMLAGGMVRDETRRAEYLETLNTEAERLTRLVDNVLDFSRLENHQSSDQRRPVAVAQVLEDVRMAWQGRCRQVQKELVIENQLAGDVFVLTDDRLVVQILGNLIDNACKYSREADDRRIWLRANGRGPRLVFEVEDRGKGVPTSECRSVFQAFRRGRHDDGTTGGVGLGLALARRWAQAIGGRLTLANRTITGACFRLELPFSG